MLGLFRFKSPVKTEMQAIFVLHEGARYDISLKRSPKAKRYTLRLRNATQDLMLTMPMRGSVRAAQDFAERHAGWIAQRMKRLPENVPFANGIFIPLRGVDHLLVHQTNGRGVVRAMPVNGVGQVLVFGDSAHVSRRISDFLRKEARKDLCEAVGRHTLALKIPARSITLKDTRTRWGSCSSRGALNFSWRLILAPPFVLDYLAAHEVAHLKHLNHSAAFWAVTRELCPHMDAAEAWLKQHGSALHRFGRTA